MKIFSKEEANLNKEFIISEMIAGKIFIYPTDTLYGFGTNMNNQKSIQKIFEIKKREKKAFLVVIPSYNWLLKNCEINKKQLELIQKKLPGPYSFIVETKKNINILNYLETPQNSLGIRIPNNWFYEFIKLANIPFSSTSVNFSGEASAKSFKEIPKEILRQVDYAIYDDENISFKASTIIDIRSNEEKILR